MTYVWRGTQAANPCQCGCGEEVAIATQTDRRYGYVKGKPRRYIKGHNRSGPKPGTPRPARASR